MKKIAINGFGRIGRAALKIIMDIPELEIAAVNDLMSLENAAYLLKYDSVYGIFEHDVAVQDGLRGNYSQQSRKENAKRIRNVQPVEIVRALLL